MSPVETTTRPLGQLDVDLDVEGVAARLLAQVTWPSVPVLVARFEGCRDDDVIDPRVQALAEIAPGPELVDALQAARDWELTDPERLFVVHLWERCAGWMQTLVAVATAEHARAICETIGFQEAEHAAGIQARLDAGERWVLDDHCPRDVEDDVAAVTGHRGWAIGQRLRAGTALAEDGPLARTGHAVLQGWSQRCASRLASGHSRTKAGGIVNLPRCPGMTTRLRHTNARGNEPPASTPTPAMRGLGAYP